MLSCSSRLKRSIETRIAYACHIVFNQPCKTPSCLNAATNRVISAINNHPDVTAVPMMVTSKSSGTTNSSVDISLIGIFNGSM